MHQRYRVFLLFLLSIFFGKSQQYHFITYSLEEGLAQSQVVGILEDEDGFLWIGTRGGLSKFNGLNFENFSKKDGLISNQVSVLFLGKDNKLFVGADGGFSVFDKKDFETVFFSDQYNSYKVNDFAEWGDTLLVATNGGGVLKYFDGLFEPLSLEESVVSLNVRSIEVFNGEIWVGSREGLYLFDEKGVKSSFDRKDVTTLNVSDIGIYNNYIAIATYGDGVLVYNQETEKLEQYSEKDGLVSNMIRSLYYDSNGVVWAASKFGFSKIGKQRVSTFNKKKGLPHNNITCLIRDIEGNIWLGSDGKGLHMFTGEAFVNFTQQDGLSSDFVMSVIQDHKANLWFSTYGGGLTRMKSGLMTTFEFDQGLSNNTVWSSIRDSNDNLWFGTSYGLSVRIKCKVSEDCSNQPEFKILTTEDGLTSNKVTYLYETKRGEIWAGTSKGVTVLNKDLQVIQSFSSKDIFPGVNVRAITEFEDRIWMGTQTGMVTYDGKRFEAFPFGEDMEESPTTYSLLATEDALWIGSNSGLYRYKNESVEKFDLDDNFNASTINFLLLDDRKQLWVGTNNGVYKIMPDDELDIHHYTTLDGLKSLETNLNAGYKDDVGNLWMGTGGGLIKYNPYLDVGTKNKLSPRLHYTGMKLFLSDFDYKKYAEEWNNDRQLPEHLVFPYNKNYLTISYIGISFKKPSAVRYRYKLEGFDKDWTPPTKSTSATYSFIPSGSYRFGVMVSGDEQNWSDPIYISFTILPPFWNTWWFYLLSVLTLFIIIYFIVRFRVKNVERKKENEKLTFQSKLIALEQQSLNASMNRHFIFNSLNSIQYFINISDKKSANKYLTNFARLIRKNLDSSTAENYMVYLSEELERVELYLSLESMRFKDKFEYSINVAQEVDTESFKVPSMMLQPFIENSIIHGILPKDDGGTILINIKKDETFLWVYIIDNGVGIDYSMTQKDDLSGDHLSKGMMITSSRVNLLRKLTSKDVSIIGPKQNTQESVFNMGTTVIIKFPY